MNEQNLKKICQNCKQEYLGKRNSSYCGTCLPKNCKHCGAEYYPTTKQQKYCSSPHLEHCFNCGKKILVIIQNREHYACNENSCKQKLRQQTSQQKYGTKHPTQSQKVKDKIKKTFAENYGEHPSRNQKVREKTEKTSLKRYGTLNPAQSEIVKQKTIETNLKKYGKKYTVQVPEIQQKMKNTNRKRYGNETPLKNIEVRRKIEETNKRRYGADNVFSSKLIQQKIQETVRKKYGVDHLFQSPEIKAKIVATNLKKYGVINPAQSPIIQERIKRTNKKRYTVLNPAQSPTVQQKMRETNLLKYSVTNYSEKHITNHEQYKNFTQFVKEGSYSIPELAKHFNITEHAIRRKVRKNKLDDCIVGRYSSSVLEEMFNNRVKSLGFNYLRNDRKILEGKELDFYFPDHNLAVEISPTSTHNMTMKENCYHYQKFINAKRKNVELITIFDWMDWDKTVSMILDKLSQTVRCSEYPPTSIRGGYLVWDNAFGWETEYIVNNYELVREEEPSLRNQEGESSVSFINDDKNLVYDCGKRIWKQRL